MDATKLIADPQVRNFGTLGGNLAHGDAANDHPAVMIALGAEIEITGKDGKRSVGIDDFFHGFLNYQIEHHLWPKMTMRQYQWVQPQVKKLCEEYGVPYYAEKSFYGALANHFSMINKLGKGTI